MRHLRAEPRAPELGDQVRESVVRERRLAPDDICENGRGSATNGRRASAGPNCEGDPTETQTAQA
jgi:hypothetical protein